MSYEQYMEENGADVSALKERVDVAKALLAEIKETAEGGPYFLGTKEMLQTAIEAAEAIIVCCD